MYSIAMIKYLSAAFAVIGIYAFIGTAEATNLAGLQFITIAPQTTTLEPYGSVTFSAEGDYATFTKAVQVNWFIEGGSALGNLSGSCENSGACTFVAGNAGGDVTIRGQVSTFSDTASIHINEPEPEEETDTDDDGMLDHSQHPFQDEIPAWAGNPIMELNQMGILRGYDNGKFGAGDLLTRGQLITIFSRILSYLGIWETPASCNQTFNDVPPENYAFQHACGFASAGWLGGSSLGVDDQVSRGETASTINQVAGADLLTANGLSLGNIVTQGQVYTDIPPSHPFFADTSVLKLLSIMTGNPDGTFKPDRTLNRAEAATVFWRLMKVVEAAGIGKLSQF